MARPSQRLSGRSVRPRTSADRSAFHAQAALSPCPTADHMTAGHRQKRQLAASCRSPERRHQEATSGITLRLCTVPVGCLAGRPPLGTPVARAAADGTSPKRLWIERFRPRRRRAWRVLVGGRSCLTWVAGVPLTGVSRGRRTDTGCSGLGRLGSPRSLVPPWRESAPSRRASSRPLVGSVCTSARS
jgi:hypothetical protein